MELRAALTVSGQTQTHRLLRYTGLGPKPLVAVDIFRITDGKLAEHWDVLQEEVPAAMTASKNAMFPRQ